MYSIPNENRTQPLTEQFKHKGYSCEEVSEEDATILIFTHEKKSPEQNTEDFLETENQLKKETVKN